LPFEKTFREVEAQISCGSLFHAAGPEYEKARSPNFVWNLGRQYQKG